MSDLGDKIRQRQDQMPPHLRGMDHNAPDELTKQVTAQLAAQTGVELYPGDIWVRVCEGNEVCWSGDTSNPRPVAFQKGYIAFGYLSRQGERAMNVYMARFHPAGNGLPLGVEALKRAPEIPADVIEKAAHVKRVLMDRINAVSKLYIDKHADEVNQARVADQLRASVLAALTEEGMEDSKIDVQVHGGTARIKVQGTIAGMPFNFGA